MSPRNWFALAVRVLGVWVLYRSVQDWLHVGVSLMGYVPQSVSKFDDTNVPLKYDLLFAVGFLAFALYLLFGAEHLTRAVYNESALPADDTDALE